MSDCRNPTAGFWITIVTVALLAYPLSVGPACWMWTRGWLPSGTCFFQIYSPLFCVASCDNNRVGTMFNWYIKAGAPDDAVILELCFIKARFQWSERFPDWISRFGGHEGYWHPLR